MSRTIFKNFLMSRGVQSPERLSTIEKKLSIKINNERNNNSNYNTTHKNKIYNSYLLNSVINEVPYNEDKRCMNLYKMNPDILFKYQEEKLNCNKLKINTNHSYSNKTLDTKDIRSLPKILKKRKIYLSLDTQKNKCDEEKSFFEEATYELHNIKKLLNRKTAKTKNLFKNEFPSILCHSNKNSNLECINEDGEKVQQVTNYKEIKNSEDLSDEKIEEIKESFKKYIKENKEINTENINYMKRQNFKVSLPGLIMSRKIDNRKKIKRNILNSEKKEKVKSLFNDEE